MPTSLVSTGVQFPDSTIQTTAATASSPPGLVLISSVSPAAASTLSALNVFSSTYDNYFIIGMGLTPASGSATISMRYAVGGSVVTTPYFFTGGSNAPQAGMNSDTKYDLTPQSGSQIYNSASFRINIYNVNSTVTKKQMDGMALYFNSGGNNNASFMFAGTFGIFNPISVPSGVQFFFDGGQNFREQGSLKIYGYKNS